MKATVAGALALALGSHVKATTEYVGMAPVALCCSNVNSTIKWAKLQYDSPQSVDDVSMAMVEADMAADVEALGSWFDFQLPESKDDGYGVVLTARVFDEKLYMPTETSWWDDRDLTQGCCASRMHVHDRSTNTTIVHDTSDILNTAMPDVATKGNSHTFDVTKEDGTTWVTLDVQYLNYTLNAAGAKADGVVVFDAETGVVRNTADGAGWYDTPATSGTLAMDETSTIYKIQHGSWDGAGDSGAAFEQWHQNGVLRWTGRDGVSYMAITHYAHHEAVIMLDPYVYPTTDGGGEVVQRFGSPGIYNATGGVTGYHHFGLDESTFFFDAVHNVHYNPSSTTEKLLGQETLTLYVNQVYYESGTIIHPETDYSFVAEFAINPQRQQDMDGPITDAVFDTDYTLAQLSFISTQQGGARNIGNGVYISSTGIASTSINQPGRLDGMEVVDLDGGHISVDYGTPNSFYDSFIRVVVEE